MNIYKNHDIVGEFSKNINISKSKNCKLHETRLIVQERILVTKSSWKLKPLSFINTKPNTSHLD